MTIGTGNKSTVTFATSGVTREFTKIGATEFELGDEEVSALDADGFAEYEMHDLVQMGETELETLFSTSDEIQLDPGAANSDLQLGMKELVTITHAQRSGETAAASFAAWAAVKKVNLPEHVNNQVQRQVITLRWLNRDGSGDLVKPLWTKATTS